MNTRPFFLVMALLLAAGTPLLAAASAPAKVAPKGPPPSAAHVDSVTTTRVDTHTTTTPLAPMPEAHATQPALAPLGSDLAAAVGEEGDFSLHPGQTLKEAFARWAQSAGYALIWSAPIDLPIEADVTFPPGTRFEDAVRLTLGAFWQSKHAVVGKLYRNRVLVISGRDA